jgi:hypothetical protein
MNLIKQMEHLVAEHQELKQKIRDASVFNRALTFTVDIVTLERDTLAAKVKDLEARLKKVREMA